MQTAHQKMCAALLLVGGLAACSRGANSTADSAGGAVIPPSSMKADTGLALNPTTGIKVATNDKVGRYLTDATGRALYMFTKDKKDSSSCTGACADKWMPYTETKAATSSDSSLDKTKIGNVTRADGKTQVSYNGLPLYLYADDKLAGDLNGASKKEFGGWWYLVSPDGKKIEAKGMMGKVDTAMHKMGNAMDTAAHKAKNAAKKPYPE